LDLIVVFVLKNFRARKAGEWFEGMNGGQWSRAEGAFIHGEGRWVPLRVLGLCREIKGGLGDGPRVQGVGLCRSPTWV
jgi:hypothetical protein